MTDTLKSGDPRADEQFWAGTAASLAPTDAAVRAARMRQAVAFAVWGIPLVLLGIGMYWRLAVGASPLHLGIFTWVFPAMVVAVIGALLWALVVEPHSRGNRLGDHLRIGNVVDDESTQRDTVLAADGQRMIVAGSKCQETAATELLEAKEKITEVLEATHRGLQIAHTALAVPVMGKIKQENLIVISIPHSARISDRVARENSRQEVLASEFASPVLPALESSKSPYSIYQTPQYLPPDTAYVNPVSITGYPPSTIAGKPAPDERANRGRNRRGPLSGRWRRK